VSALV
jgi:F420H(2)-dependent quinone reductase